MGIVVKQSIKNTVITFVGFTIGAINSLFMYTHFLGEDYYGLSTVLLAAATIMMPLMAFGIHNTLVKFYATHQSEEEKSKFLNLVLVLPLLILLPIFLVLGFYYSEIAAQVSQVNPVIFDYVWIIPVIGLFMGYFEIFYAWVKVHLQSVFGNFVKEVLLRIFISLFLFLVYLNWISKVQFIYSLLFIYFAIMLVMALVAFSVRKPQFHLKFPKEKKEILVYSSYIIFSSSIAVLLLDIDKFMISQYIPIDQAAYYSVAIFIALTISVPMRAMHQITHPITTDLMARNKYFELDDLYKKSAITLQAIGGYIMLGILTNIHEVYALLPQKYSGGVVVVFLISISKFFDLMLGNNNSIIFNSKYYRTVLFLGLCLVGLTIGLNRYFIPNFGIEGAAIATFISVGLYTLAKFLFVVFRMKLFPFTQKTLISLLIIVLSFVAFYFWSFPFHPVLNIFLKSVMLTLVYWSLNFKFAISKDINDVLKKVALRLIPSKN